MDEAELTADCVKAMRTALPPEAELELTPGGIGLGDAHIDGRLHIHGPWGRIEVPVETRVRVNKAAIALMDRRFRTQGEGRNHDQGEAPRWVLFTEHVTARQARELREGGIGFVDTRGNVHIWGPGLYVWVTGNKPAARRQRTLRLTRRTAARVLFVLLQDPHRAQAPYRELADHAGVAPDTVNRVFNELQAKGYLRTWGTREREVTRLPELMELWTLGYEDELRPKLQPKRCQWTGAGPIEDIVNVLPMAPPELPVLLGGELAAAVLTDMIRPTTAVLHVPHDAQLAAMKALGLVPRPDGPITLLHTFGETNEWRPPRPVPTHLADPLLVHAELMRQGDDRTRMVADEIYDQYIVRRFPDDR